MRVLTGPRSSTADEDDLSELAGLYGLVPVSALADAWLDVETLYRAPGWRRCPTALADVQIATAFGVPTKDLPS